MKLEASQTCTTSGKIWRLILHRMCTQERQNASQKIARGPLNLLQTTQSCCPFIAAGNAVKVHAFVHDAYTHHLHLRASKYLTHIYVLIIGN